MYNVEKIKSMSTNVAYLILGVDKQYTSKVIQVYTSTSTYFDVVEAWYKDIS